MEQAEIELLVNELETRMDRLRVLYEQYFLGFERVEPHVPKKDIERRVAVLRKEQIRNTGIRFRFQMILQRYSTYQTYWFRICRQIEMGTYKRDVRRATARFGIDPTKERELADELDDPADAASPAAAKPPQRQVQITDAEMEELEDGTAFLEPLDAEEDPFAEMPPPAAVAPAPRERFASAVRLDLDDLADPFEEHDPFPKPAAPPSAPKIRIAQRAGASPAPLPVEAARDTERRMPVASRVIVTKRVSLPDAAAAPPAPPGSPASRPVLPAAATPAPRVAIARSAPTPAPAAASVPAPAPARAPLAKPVRAPVPAAPPPRAVGDLSGDRFGEIYSKYVATRREHNEPTHAITRDALAKQLSESTERLKQKHGGKPIDFEVVVKDGKTILRPVVK